MKKPKLDVTRTVPKPSEILRHDENQTTITGEKLKPETDYEGLERQWQREAWKERELFDSGGISDICSLDDLMRGEKSMADEKKKAPKHERAGALSMAIWENKGEFGTYPTFTFQRGYQDKDKKWQNTETLRAQDLLPLAELLRNVYSKYVATKEAQGE
jgi:hypothetical protein